MKNVNLWHSISKRFFNHLPLGQLFKSAHIWVSESEFGSVTVHRKNSRSKSKQRKTSWSRGDKFPDNCKVCFAIMSKLTFTKWFKFKSKIFKKVKKVGDSLKLKKTKQIYIKKWILKNPSILLQTIARFFTAFL